MSNPESAPARIPRGRPYRPAVIPAGVRGAGLRVAWMLRANRVLGPDRGLATMSTFAAVFHGGVYVNGVSDSTVSRWETGAVRAPFLAVRRYEELLGLAAGQLISVADTIYRYAAPTLTTDPVLARADPSRSDPDEHARLDRLLEQALSQEPMSGWQWDELTGQLLALPRFFLQQRVWAELSTRLVQESVVAHGVPWLQRFEALTRLLGHTASRRHAIDACVRLVTGDHNQSFVEPISVLDATSHPDAATFLLRQLSDPINERARYGALLGCVRKVRYGHFTDTQLDDLTRGVLDVIQDRDSDVAARPLAAELLRLLPDERRHGLVGELGRALAKDRVLQVVHDSGRMVGRTTSRVMLERIIGSVAAALGNDAVFSDDVVPQLVDEMLFSPVLDIRFNAGLLIWASPYSGPVAAAVAAELSRNGAASDPRVTVCLLAALRILGGAPQRPLVERLVLATGLPPQVSLAAVHTIGHVGGTSSDAFWLNAIDRHSERWRRRADAHSAEALGCLVYGLGVKRHHDLLRRVRDDETAPRPVREAGAWWLARPERLFSEPAAA